MAAVGTDVFYDNYSGIKLNNMMSYVEDVWESNIEDGSGSYEALFDVYTSTEVPDSSLCQSCSLRDRTNDIDDWLYNNWGSYNTYDVILVADYYEDVSQSFWGIAQQTAGTSRNKCAVVDVDDIESTSGAWSNEKSEGVAAHEVLHMFMDESNSEHFPRLDSSGDATLSYDAGDIAAYCGSEYNVDTVIKDISSCVEYKVRNWIDNN